MPVQYEKRHATNPRDFRSYDTARIRDEFLISDIMSEGEIRLTYSHIERFIVGGAVPGKEPLFLETIDLLKADYFLERRELGIINVGGQGSVIIDGESYALAYKEALYVGRGSEKVEFCSADENEPARFYLNSAPAHSSYPIKKITLEQADAMQMGSMETSNDRVINKLIVNGIVETCQLQMGMTELKPGSVWNTMPAHTHDRRMECYFYFEVPEGQAVCHFMGEPEETRHIWVANEQAVLSPPWSIHSGSGTSNYIFIWSMAGENLDYSDMDFHNPDELK